MKHLLKDKLCTNILVFGLVVIVALMVAIPAFAQTETYWWKSTAYGEILNGSVNGQTYQLDAGTLTNSGTLAIDFEESEANLNTTTAYDWKIEVVRERWGPNESICVTDAIELNTANGGSNSYNKDCGTIIAGEYYLVIFRTDSNGFVVEGNGSLQVD